jgi:hypothetical protein
MRSSTSQIPWVQRHDRGTITAFWQTIHHVLFRHPEFCQEIARAVDRKEAKRFRWLLGLSIGLVSAVIGTVTYLALSRDQLASCDLASPNVWAFGDLLRWSYQAVYPMTAFCLAAIPAFVISTDWTASYLACAKAPEHLRERAATLSYYLAAPLIFWPLGLLALIPFAAPAEQFDPVLNLVLLGVGITAFLGAPGWYWSRAVASSKRFFPAGPVRSMGTAVMLPLSLTIMLAAAIVMTASLSYLVYLIEQSFRFLT